MRLVAFYLSVRPLLIESYSASQQTVVTKPSGIIQLQKSSNWNNDITDAMNLDNFIFSDYL